MDARETAEPTSDDAVRASWRRRSAGCRRAAASWGLPSLVTAEIIGRAGFDFAVIDLEHGAGSLETALGQLVALEAAGVAGLARAPQADGPWIKRALDLGAAGVIVPRIESAAEAEAAVRELRYGPQGRRGAATRVARAARYGADPDYLARWNGAAVLLVEIESPAALAQADAIAAVDGVDALFFGPADFAAASGFPGAAEVARGFERMAAAARAAGKLVGAPPFGERKPAALIAEGADIVVLAHDVTLLREAAEAALAASRLPG